MHDPLAPEPLRLSTSDARRNLSQLVTHVQHPETFVVLTRNGKPDAALVSLLTLKRIWSQELIDAVIEGRHRPARFTFGTLGHSTNREAAEAIQRLQYDRRTEREVLAKAGLRPVPGGELEVEAAVVKSAWWSRVANVLRKRWKQSQRPPIA